MPRLLVNAYATCRDVGAPAFPHELRGKRDRSDPGLAAHLQGFVGFVLDRGKRKMTPTLYAVMRHIERVRHHLSFTITDAELDALTGWARRANAILFMQNGDVLDPAGSVLVDAKTGAPETGATVPYPEEALARRARSLADLEARGVRTPAILPPVAAETEVELRAANEVGGRTLALLVTALRAESLAHDEAIPVAELLAKLPVRPVLSPDERAFLDADEVPAAAVQRFTWGYEAFATLAWALGTAAELPDPTAMCDATTSSAVILPDVGTWLAAARLRPTGEILDALDLHTRLHWAIREADLRKQAPPAGLVGGVIRERHRALNWLIRFEDAAWDDVDTPT